MRYPQRRAIVARLDLRQFPTEMTARAASMKNFLIVALVAVTIILAWRLAEVENQRYALLLNMCPGRVTPSAPDFECLKRVQTRTSWLWNLYYGLKA